MQWTLPLFCILILVLPVFSIPQTNRKTQIYMATIDLDTNRKRHVDPEVILDIGSQLPPIKTPAKRNVTQAPDYGDYEDYELTARPEETTTSSSRNSDEKEHPLLDSQFKPHVKISMNNQKSSGEVRDEVSRLMGDLHREELTLRTTVTKEDMTSFTSSPVDIMLLGNETMFFSDEEGSGEGVEQDELLNSTKTPTTTTVATTTTSRRPLLFTTLIQEVKSLPVTARPDPFAHLDYDLSDHSNIKKPKPINNLKANPERSKKYKLHGGAVDTQPRSTIVKPSKVKTVRPLLVRSGKQPLNRRKNLRKMKKIDRMRRVKHLNHRVRAQNRMRLRKVLSKMIFGPRDSDVTSSSSPSSSNSSKSPKTPKSTKRKFVGSDGIVTPHPFSKKKINTKAPIDFKKRDKREAQLQTIQEAEPETSDTGAGGAWDTVPIEKSIIESIHFEPHPYYHLRASGITQVEPSALVNEEALEDDVDQNMNDVADDVETFKKPSSPLKSGLVQVSLHGNSVNEPRKLKMVTLKSVKKVVSKKKEKNANGVAFVMPSAKKPTMLELLIGDFLERLPPTARNPYLTEEQWS